MLHAETEVVVAENASTGGVRIGKHMALFGVVGIVGAIVTAVMAFTDGKGPGPVLQSSLFAVIMFMSLTLGCFGLLVLHHVLQGKWGLGIVRIFEAGGHIWNFVLMAVLFIPIFIGAKYLYPWARPEQIASDHVLEHRVNGYFNWIYLRFAIYFLVWAWYAYRLRRSVKVQEATGKFREQQWRANWASPGIVFLILSVTFAYTDWVMSIDPHWYSTMYGLWFVVGMALGGMSLATLIVCVNAKKAPYNQIVHPGLTRDFGNLLLTFTMLWGYTNISQYLIIWSGNLPTTTTYLINRSLGHWNYLGLWIVLGQFFIPFFALLSPSVKATPKKLAVVAVWILAMRVLDHFHVVEPFYRQQMGITIADITAFIGVGGLWAMLFSRNINRLPLLTSYDPRILEVPEHAH